MNIADIMFYLFSLMLLGSALLVVSANNPVHAVLFLIFGFFNAAGLLLLIGAEFLAMLLVVVYVGAVMVLFLFVVMMLDVNFAALRTGMAHNRLLALGLGAILLLELLIAGYGLSHIETDKAGAFAKAWQTGADGADNITQLGQVLYTKYFLLFQGAGVILLVAMIGAIVLTLRQRSGVKRQRIADQVARRGADEITLVAGD